MNTAQRAYDHPRAWESPAVVDSLAWLHCDHGGVAMAAFPQLVRGPAPLDAQHRQTRVYQNVERDGAPTSRPNHWGASQHRPAPVRTTTLVFVATRSCLFLPCLEMSE